MTSRSAVEKRLLALPGMTRSADGTTRNKIGAGPMTIRLPWSSVTLTDFGTPTLSVLSYPNLADSPRRQRQPIDISRAYPCRSALHAASRYGFFGCDFRRWLVGEFELELVEEQLQIGLWLGVAGEHDL